MRSSFETISRATATCGCSARGSTLVPSVSKGSATGEPSTAARVADSAGGLEVAGAGAGEAAVSAATAIGVIARLEVDRGDIVRKGQVLGKLEDGVEAAALKLARARAGNEYTIKAAQARLDFLRRKNDRAGQLAAKSIGSQASAEEADADANVAEQQLKEAELNLEIARIEVGQAEETLKQRTLVSPIEGVVTERLLQPGEYRNEQSPILTLAQIDPLRVEVYVPTTQYSRIQVGSTAKVRPQQPIGGAYEAIVTVVDRVLDAASGTFGVRLALPNPDERLPAGIRCKVQFELQPPGTPEVASTKKN
jgi:RND family efflux transporter MFP subunit